MGRFSRRAERAWRKSIARERIEILLGLAEKEALQHNFSRAQKYVSYARKIGMRYNVSIPRYGRRKICRKCNSFLLPPVNALYRLNQGKLTITCKTCGNRMRIPYRDKKYN